MSLTKGYAPAPKVNWLVSDEDLGTIIKVVKRAVKEFPDMEIDTLKSQMDITATHLNGCPLNLEKFLEFDLSNFGHDFFGIRRYIDRSTGKMTGWFLPRCYNSKAVKS